MKLRYVLGISGLALASVSNAQTTGWRSDTLRTDTSYRQDAYFNLESGQVKAEPNNNWDLAFPGGAATMMDHSIIINDFGNGKNGKLMELTGKTAADFGTNLTADTAGKAAIRNIPTTWEEGAFGLATGMGGTNPSWGDYNISTHYIDGAKLYAYVTGGVGYQIYIQQYQASAAVATRKWIFKVAKLDGTEQGTYELMPSNYAGKHLMYFNLATRAGVDRDPNYTDWHLLATKYGDFYGGAPGGAVMSTTGILTSPGVEVAKAANLVPNDADYNNFASNYSEDKNVIGGTYKAVNMTGTPPGWEVYDSLSYFIKNHLVGTDSGDIYQVYFDYFPASTSGDVKIGIQVRKVYDYVKPSNIKNVDQNIGSITLAPNPSVSGTTNILIDAKTNVGATVINVTDINGRVINTFNHNVGAGLNQLRLNVSAYQSGLYMVNIFTANGRQSVKLLVQN